MSSLHIKGEVIVRKHHVSIEAQLDEALTVLTNIRSNPMLLQALAAYGYSEARLAEGEALHEAALAFYQEKIKAYGMLRRISDTNSSAVQQTKYLYSQHVKMTRVALDRNPGALQMLSAAGGQKKTVVAWIVQAQHFYTSALADSDILSQLNTFGLSRTILEEGASRVAALSAARAAYRQQRAIAQHATSQRDKALLALSSWVHDLKQIARIVLRNTPQLLEQIGIAAKS